MQFVINGIMAWWNTNRFSYRMKIIDENSRSGISCRFFFCDGILLEQRTLEARSDMDDDLLYMLLLFVLVLLQTVVWIICSSLTLLNWDDVKNDE